MGYNEIAVSEIIRNYQETLVPDLSRPLESEQRRWDEGRIIEQIKNQKKHFKLCRLSHPVLRQIIRSVVPQMKNMELEDSSDSEELEGVEMMVVNDTNHMNASLLSIYKNRGNDQKVDHGETVDSEKQEKILDDKQTPQESERQMKISESAARIKKAREANESSKRKKQRKEKSGDKIEQEIESKIQDYSPPNTKLSDLGGIDSCIEEVLQLIAMPLKCPKIYTSLGIQPPRGVLLHGPPGCGKTLLAQAIAGSSKVPFIQISAPQIVSGMSGESEKKIRDLFATAKEHAPCILFIDEIDAITPKRETAQREMERRIVAQLLTCMDDLGCKDDEEFKPVLIIGATNRPDSIDPALRRAGRFDREISMGVPTESSRALILEKLCRGLKIDGKLDFGRIARLTPGYVGADLNALKSEAGMIAVRRVFDSIQADTQGSAMQIDSTSITSITQILGTDYENVDWENLDSLSVTHADFIAAIAKVQPSSKREGFITVPDISWSDVGALSSTRQELQMAVVQPIKNPELFHSVGIYKPTGVLLYGPPGCGKTMLAKAVASESCCNFISIKGPELLNKYVGESERGIRSVFERARASSPCVIFFDEVDALCPNRSGDSDSVSSSRLVNTLLSEMDGMSTRSMVYVIAATNRPDMIDPAMLRPGRLDKTLYVDLPNEEERAEILKTITKKTPLDGTVNLTSVAKDSRCDGFSGADLAALVREAAVSSIRSYISSETASAPALKPQSISVTLKDFDCAFTKMAPSVSKRDRRKYELMKVRFGTNSKDTTF